MKRLIELGAAVALTAAGSTLLYLFCLLVFDLPTLGDVAPVDVKVARLAACEAERDRARSSELKLYGLHTEALVREHQLQDMVQESIAQTKICIAGCESCIRRCGR